jgi:hypothetical protein
MGVADGLRHALAPDALELGRGSSADSSTAICTGTLLVEGAKR